MTIDVSLIVCSRNRGARLAPCLDAIAALYLQGIDFELVLVDNGSTDDTAEIMRQFLCRFPAPGTFVIAREPGNSAGRNAGVAVSRGTVVAFTDDDCYVRPDFIEQVHRVFRDPRVGFMAGRILLHDPRDHPITINESTEPLRFPAGRFVECGVVQGANMAFRRQALVAAGGFDPRFGAGTSYAGEDWDLAARVGAAGYDGVYAPGPTVSHHHGRDASAAERLVKFYNHGSGAVTAKLLLAPGTRWTYARGTARRILGDLKQHRRKILQQTAGAVAYWREQRAGNGTTVGRVEGAGW
jgi:glycosyltransferase involved in cell wall biosynthesis